MPKENLNHVKHPSDLREGEWQGAQFALHWTATHEDAWSEGFAQLSVTLQKAQLLAIVKGVEDGTILPGDLPDTVTIYSDPLSYHEMNADVRSFKRGRDAVHGAPE